MLDRVGVQVDGDAGLVIGPPGQAIGAYALPALLTVSLDSDEHAGSWSVNDHAKAFLAKPCMHTRQVMLAQVIGGR